jgi:hypothetical protein
MGLVLQLQMRISEGAGAFRPLTDRRIRRAFRPGSTWSEITATVVLGLKPGSRIQGTSAECPIHRASFARWVGNHKNLLSTVRSFLVPLFCLAAKTSSHSSAISVSIHTPHLSEMTGLILHDIAR